MLKCPRNRARPTEISGCYSCDLATLDPEGLAQTIGFSPRGSGGSDPRSRVCHSCDLAAVDRDQVAERPVPSALEVQRRGNPGVKLSQGPGIVEDDVGEAQGLGELLGSRIGRVLEPLLARELLERRAVPDPRPA